MLEDEGKGLLRVKKGNAYLYYWASQKDKDDAVANDPLKDQHPSMPVHNESRRTRVTFGGGKKDN